VVIWNLGTWYFGLPSSSSHTLIGSIIGVGITNQLMAPKSGTSGVDWSQAGNIGKSLLISPIVGFVAAALLLVLMKVAIPNKKLYEAPVGTAPPPFWIRCLLMLTCTGVSFAHGSNDGQKGMGLIMLILVGTVPTAYALNRAVSPADVQDFIAVSARASDTLGHYGAADMFGLPVSTTHVLSSGVAGTMAANRSGLQMSTVRNLLLAWVLTLPISILLSGGLFFVFSHFF